MRNWIDSRFPIDPNKRRILTLLLFAMALLLPPFSTGQTQVRAQTRMKKQSSEMTLEADTQKQAGKIFYADGHVDILYGPVRLRADHVEYNEETKMATARGHVQFDYQMQHMDADEGTFNLKTGRGSFRNVRGTVTAQHLSNPSVLVSPNPLTFAAATMERTDDDTFVVIHAWVTVCKPDSPQWKFYAPRAVIHLQKSVALDNASFRLFYVPIIYLPYASVPIARKLRQSGFLIPDVGNTTAKGYVFGDSFYWAPTEWMDATVGAEYLSRRGWSQTADIRMKPWQNATLTANYFGVFDRGIALPSGVVTKQGGHEDHVFFDALLPGGWRAVADLDQLSSLTFRLAFSETFEQAVNSEVRNTSFLTKSMDGFSVSLASMSYKNFLSAQPDTAIDLRTAPEVRVSSVDRAPWQKLPVYVGFDFFADAVHRETNVPPGFETPSFVSRTEFAPNVTMPLHWGSWLGITPSFTLRSLRYGGQLQNGIFVDRPLVRTTEEFSLALQPPSFDRVWDDGATKWKHVIEPKVEYHYVNGVEDFSKFLHFDEDDTLTDTNDVQYGITQRLYRRGGDGQAQELVSWNLTQKYYFDPGFGGALVPNARNVFQALDSLTPFAFADSLHRFSPIISDLRIEPGGRFDTQFRVDFDPERNRLTAIGSLVKIRPYRESFLTLADFSTINIPMTSSVNPLVILPRSNQVRALAGYGSLNRRGWNTAIGFSYDVSQSRFQNQIVQLSYNGSCCGIGFEYRRLSLGAVRNENQFRVVFLIANLGSFGNLRRQENIF
ncbi:MAG TPA: LPS assembly protein LptD [Candidatus Acidoferrales bacterium]|nr:LPS assembly protein LptD [Candidatus Acidoferrales bacterium]